MAARTNTASKINTAGATDAQIKTHLEQQLDEAAESLWAKMRGFKPSSSMRTWVKLIARVTLYAAGFVAALYLISALSMALQVWGWPLFLVAIIEIAGLILSMIAAWTLSDKVVDFVADGGVTRVIGNTASWIKGRFSKSSTFMKQRMSMN